MKAAGMVSTSSSSIQLDWELGLEYSGCFQVVGWFIIYFNSEAES